MTGRAAVAAALLFIAAPSVAQHEGHDGHDAMRISNAGVVMNQNPDTLPRGCDTVSREHAFVVRAGREYATLPGAIFGMSEHEWRVEPCSRVTVTLINEDEVRHQWMVHGLPRYLYPAGMFHVEAMGGHTQTGTFIVPAEDRSFLVHCDLSQHMEKGMRGQLVVGRGSGDLWAVTGITDRFYRYPYLPAGAGAVAAGTAFGVFLGMLILLRYLKARSTGRPGPQ